jgi:hypothetical protein
VYTSDPSYREAPPDLPPLPEPTGRRGWGRISAAQVIVILLMTLLGWLIAGIVGLALMWRSAVAAMPHMVGEMMPQLLGMTVDDYLLRMSYRDADRAYDFVTYTPGRLDALYRSLDEEFFLYDGYLSVTVREVKGLPEVAPGDPAFEDGSIYRDGEYTVNGEIAYEDGTIGHFTAVIVSGEDGWQIDSIAIVVPQEKIDAYQAEHP